MNSLTKFEQNLYSKLVHLYNKENWQTVASLDRFLQIKYEAATNPTYATSLYNVWQFAQNDF